jgi:VWFA-related protein
LPAPAVLTPSAESSAPALPASISPVVAEEEREVAIHPVDSLPGLTSDPNPAAPASGKGAFTLNVTSRLVDISLVAYDKHNKPVTDLKPEDIEIYDNGRKQQVRNFHHPTPETAASPAPAAASTPSDTFSNTAPATAVVENAPDLLILLMDEAHLPFQVLNRARGEVLRFLKATRPDSRIALYSVGDHGFHVIQDVTQDHALVATRLAAWMPNIAAVSNAQDLDMRNRQQFDTVRNPSDLNSVNGNHTAVPDYIETPDPLLRQMGNNPLRNSLESMIALARHFAAVPGHKSLAWISGDAALADWDDQAVGMEKGTNQFGPALLHAREALNEAHIALYAVDASPPAGQGSAISAELANQNIQVNAVSTANSAPGGPPTRGVNNGRVTAEMQQDLHGIQGPVRELAEATGGLAVNKGGDLKQTLDGIEQHASATYEVGFGPDTPADNKYHTLQLKIPSRKDVKLRYRTGYLYNEEAASTKQRFQQAIWSPQDANAIELIAEPVPAAESTSGKPTLKLRIGFPKLTLTQRADRWTDDLYIFVAVRDDATQKAQVSGETLRLSLKQASYESGMPAGIPYQRVVETASKLGSIRILVVDANSGRMGSVTIPASALHN